MDTLTLGVFSPSVLLDVARSTGRLAAADLLVDDVAVPSSPAQFTSLRDGAYDAVFTSPDNALAYRFLSKNPLKELLDIEIVSGVDRGLGLCLGARPGIVDPAELRGGRLAVDVPTSGFAFVAYALLEDLGLSHSSLDVLAIGSTPTRAAALRDGGCDVTVLNAGNELAARAHGCVLLADVTRLGPYLGTVVVRMRGRGDDSAVDRLAAVLTATAAAVTAGALESEVHEAAVRLLGLSDTAATEHALLLKDPARGLVPDGKVDRASLATLVTLRGRFLPDNELDRVVGRLDEFVCATALT